MSKASDLRERISNYLGRDVPSHEEFVDTVNEVLDQAEADAAELLELRDSPQD